MKSAKKAKLKKLIVALAPSAERTIFEPAMKRTPATTWPSSSAAVGGSTGEMLPRKKADQRNESESTTRAYGAERACTSPPATLGPPTNEKARLPKSSEFALTYCSRGTSETNSVLCETKKSMLSVPVRKATT